MNKPFLHILSIMVTSIVISVTTSAQTPAGGNIQVEYKSGQVWQFEGGQETVTVLEVEDIHKLGRVVHVRIDLVPAASCQGIDLTTSIEHVALTEKMLRKSQISLVRENAQIPETYLAAYREWRKEKKHQVIRDQTVGDVIRRAPQWGAICNLVPATT